MSIDTREADLQEAIELVERLTEALRVRTSISCAKGILMERHGVGPEAALSLLNRLSVHTSTTMHGAAERVIAGEPVEALGAPQPRSPH